MPSRTLRVDGLNAENHEGALVNAIEKLPGVEKVTADHNTNEVVVEGDADDQAIRDAVRDAGFKKIV